MTPTPEPTPKPIPAPAPVPAPAKPATGIGTTIGTVVATVLLTLGIAGGIGLGAYEWWIHTPNEPPAPIALEQNVQGHVGFRIVIHADTPGKSVKWQLLQGPRMDIDVWPEEGDSKVCNLVTPTQGDYTVQAVTVVGGEPVWDKTHVLVDVGPTPPSPPGPGPNPPGPTPGPIPAGQLRVLMTYDKDVPVAQGQLDVLKSAATQKLVPAGNWKVYSTTQTFGDELPIWKGVFDKRKSQVGIVLFNGTDGSVAYEGPIQNGMAEAAALIKKFGG